MNNVWTWNNDTPVSQRIGVDVNLRTTLGSSKHSGFRDKQAHKLGRCDSYLQNLKTLPTH